MSSEIPDVQPPRPRSKAVSCLVLVGLALVAAVFAVRLGFAAWERLAPPEVVQPPPTPVEVVRLSPQPFERTVPVAGTLAPVHDVAVFPKLGGKVVAVMVGLGDAVSEGQPMARVEVVEYSLQAQQAEVGLAMAEDAADLAERAYGRVDTVHQQLGADALARQSLEEAEIQAQGARTQAEVARLDRDLSRQVVRNATMFAPVDGRVSKVWARLGSMVGSEFPAFQVADTSELVLRCEVGDTDLPALSPGQPVRLRTDALPGEEFAGEVIAVSPSLDAMTRRAPVEIAVPNPDGRLIGNTFARGEIVASTYEAAHVVPAEAVIFGEDGAAVLLVRDGAALQKTVEVIGRANGSVAIEGLDDGIQVILPGAQRLSPGEPVVVVERGGER